MKQLVFVFETMECDWDTDEGEHVDILNTKTIFTLRGVVLDGLLK